MKNVTEVVEATGKIIDESFTSQEEYNAQINDRYNAELSSDSWLTKNVRPLILLALLVMWFSILFLKLDLGEGVVESIESMTNVAFIFYFASRGGEKIMRSTSRKRK